MLCLGHFAKSQNLAFLAFFSKGQFLDSMMLTQKLGLSPKLDSQLGTIGNITEIGFPILDVGKIGFPIRTITKIGSSIGIITEIGYPIRKI